MRHSTTKQCTEDHAAAAWRVFESGRVELCGSSALTLLSSQSRIKAGAERIDMVERAVLDYQLRILALCVTDSGGHEGWSRCTDPAPLDSGCGGILLQQCSACLYA